MTTAIQSAPAESTPRLALSIRRPFPIEALPAAYEWLRKVRMLEDHFPSTADTFAVLLKQLVAAGAQLVSFFIGRELCGFVVFFRVNPILAELCYFVLEPSLYRDGAFLEEAIGLLCEELFSDGYEKLWTRLSPEEKPLIEAFCLKGALEEGWFPRHTLRGGKLADVLALGLDR